MQAENQQNNHTQPEIWHRNAEKGNQHTGVIENGILLYRRPDADRHREHQGQQAGGQSQLNGLGQADSQLDADKAASLKGFLHCAPILHNQRVVHAPGLPHKLRLLWGGRPADSRPVRVAGGEIEQKIDDKRGAEQHWQQDCQPLHDIFPHGFPFIS